MTVNEVTWDTIWSFGIKLSICIRGRAIQFKISHRLHIPPPKGFSSTALFLLYVSSVKLTWELYLIASGLVINFKDTGMKLYVKWREFFILLEKRTPSP